MTDPPDASGVAAPMLPSMARSATPSSPAMIKPARVVVDDMGTS